MGFMVTGKQRISMYVSILAQQFLKGLSVEDDSSQAVLDREYIFHILTKGALKIYSKTNL